MITVLDNALKIAPNDKITIENRQKVLEKKKEFNRTV